MATEMRCLLAALLLSGCTMGPDFKRPEGWSPASWFRKETAQPAAPVAEAPVDAAWWKQWNDETLDRLVARIAAENFDLQTAGARLEQSRAQLGIAAADLYPRLGANASYTREKQSDEGVISLFGGGASGGASAGGGAAAPVNGIPNTVATPAFNIFQYGIDASWELDLWGRVRRNVESARAAYQASEEMRRGVEVSVIAELVRDYVQLRGTQASLQIVRQNVEVARRTAALARERARVGLTNDIDLANADAQAATAASQLPQLEQQQSALMNAIALLLGQPPGSLDAELVAARPMPPLPPQLPVGLPSELAQRRPDIRQAEAELHAATAQIGAAEADFFPRLTLSGDFMLQALHLRDLNGWDARGYSIGPAVSLPIFEGGRRVSTLELRNAQQKEAALTYQRTVLNAFHEVDNALNALRAEQARAASLGEAAARNEVSLKLSTSQYQAGLASFLDVLVAQRALLDTQLQAAQSAASTGVDVVALYKALGGGWQQDLPDGKAKGKTGSL